jgi:hypothetical protein
MANNSRVNARFTQKHDIEENWEKASSFYPLLGELIVYDPDATHSYPRFKFGIWDGESTPTAAMLVKNLPFVTYSI